MRGNLVPWPPDQRLVHMEGESSMLWSWHVRVGIIATDESGFTVVDVKRGQMLCLACNHPLEMPSDALAKTCRCHHHVPNGGMAD